MFSWPPTDARAGATSSYVEDEVIIRFQSAQVPALQLHRLGVSEWREYQSGSTGIAKLRSSETVGQAIQRLQSDPAVASVQPNVRYQAADFEPNDELRSLQWNLDQIQIGQAWALDTIAPVYGGDPSVIVAVLDTGIAYENYSPYVTAPDFTQTRFVAGWDFVNNDAHANDDHGHGTHMAGTIAQSTNNSISESGIAFETTLMPIKVLAADGSGTTETVAQGIEYAVAHGADVINLSLAATSTDPILQAAVADAVAQGVIVVAAAGNEGSPTLDYPAAYAGVISVGASRYDRLRPSYSNYGPGLTLMAPGGDFDQDQNNDGYLDGILQQSFTNVGLSLIQFSDVWAEGTSSATAHVTGAVGLLLSAGAAAADVTAVLTSTAQDLGAVGYDTDYGYGTLDLAAAMRAVVDDTIPPTTNLTLPATSLVNDYYRVAPSIQLSAADAQSGVDTIYYFWDEQAPAAYQAALLVPEGIHQLSYYSIDRAGNHEVVKTQLFKVDTAAPSIAHVMPASTSILHERTYTVTGTVADIGSGVDRVFINTTQAQLEPSGEFSLPVHLRYGSNQFTVTVFDRAGNTSEAKNVVITSFPTQGVAMGAGPTGGPQVRIFSPAGKNLNSFFAYAATFRGGVTVATGDVDGDREEEIVVAPGVGGGPQIRVFDQRGRFEKDFYAYAAQFRGGVNLAVGDVDGDGIAEIITAPMGAGGPNIRIFGYRAGSYQPTTENFMAYASGFRGGVSVAAGDLDGDGKDEIVTAPLKNGGPQLRVFGFRAGKFQPVIQGLMAYAPSFRGGVTVATGDLDGDGRAEIITGVAGAGGPQVRTFEHKADGSIGLETSGFFAFSPDFRGGINVSAADIHGDGRQEIVVSVRSQGSPLIRFFSRDGKKIERQFLGLPETFKSGITIATN